MPACSRPSTGSSVFDPAPRETLGRIALAELESVIRNVTDQLAVFRRRALAAEAQVREQESTLQALREAADRAKHATAEVVELRRTLAASQQEAARVGGLEAALREAREAAARGEELEAALAVVAAPTGEGGADDDAPRSPRQITDLAAENATLRERLHEALDRTRVIADRVRFLRQQLDHGGER